MISIFQYIEIILGSFPFLLITISIALLIKFYIFIFLLMPGWTKTIAKKQLAFIMMVTISATVVDVAWILWLFRALFYPEFPYKYIVFFIRISWAFSIAQYQGLSLFIGSLTERIYRYPLYQKIFLTTSSSIGFIYFYLAIFKFDSRPVIEYTLHQISPFYLFGPLMITTLIFTIKKISIAPLPKILKKQIKLVINYLIVPFLVADFIQLYPFYVTPKTVTGSFASIAISTILITYAMIFSAKKIMGLRFLNLYNYVQSPYKFSFIRDFKKALQQLSDVSTMEQLHHITQSFFKQAFNIPTNYSALYLQHTENSTAHQSMPVIPYARESDTECTVSNYINNYENFIITLREKHILIYDEIAFSNFYEDKLYDKYLINFLNDLNADIFLPIFQKHSLIGYIIITRNARVDHFYNMIEKDEMLVFANYLNSIINSLHHRIFNNLAQQEQVLRKELAAKQAEIHYYKEVMRSLLKDSQQRKIGVIFYKNHKFIYGNKEARELIHININTEEDHPITQTFKKLVHYTQEYKKGHILYIHDPEGQRLMLSCNPSLESNNFIISISYPEVSEIVKKQLDHLRNPSEWDYILSFETTKIGKLINQLIPSNNKKIMTLKIELLKIMFSKKALFLQLPTDELFTIVEILHYMSIRETLHLLTLQQPTTTHDIEIKLFGINPLLDAQQQQPLLKQLDSTGTLFIQNIEFLDLNTQNKLAEFIKYGFFHGYKNNHIVLSNVRIICSSSKNLSALAQENNFSKVLLNELQTATLSIPSLLNLSPEEFYTFAQEYSSPESNEPLNELIEYVYHQQQSDRLLHLQNFKQHIQQKLLYNTQKNTVYSDSSHTSDNSLLLGKKALKDPSIMTQLWNQFKDQSKIAVALGVHRSSVYRYYKKYNLTNNTHDA